MAEIKYVTADDSTPHGKHFIYYCGDRDDAVSACVKRQVNACGNVALFYGDMEPKEVGYVKGIIVNASIQLTEAEKAIISEAKRRNILIHSVYDEDEAYTCVGFMRHAVDEEWDFEYRCTNEINMQSKPKLYFICHKDDKKYYDAIADDVLSILDCVIYASVDVEKPRTKSFYNFLDDIQMAIIPVTTRFLLEGGECVSEFLHVRGTNKPVVPIIMEDGISDMFNKKWEDLQCLDRNERDVTAIDYHSKLKKHFSGIFADEKLVERIRASFDGRLFLSYRKMDRELAGRLMRRIHRAEGFENTAIWYDEFLAIGENFNDSIKDQIEKSNAVIMAVTPNTLKQVRGEDGALRDNYVIKMEYPCAKEAGKLVIAVEMMESDKGSFLKKCPDVDFYVDMSDDALTNALEFVSLRSGEATPERDYLMGRAYLEGIDVENDNNRAVDLLTRAGKRGSLEAITLLGEMYKTGRGVVRNSYQSASWHQLRADALEKKYLETQSDEDMHYYFWALVETGDEWRAYGDKEKAESCYVRAKILYGAKSLLDDIGLRNFVIIDSRLSEFYLGIGNLDAAISCGERAVENADILYKRDEREDVLGTVQCVNEILGDAYRGAGNLEAARDCYIYSLDTVRSIIANSRHVEDMGYEWKMLNKLGDLCEEDEDIECAMMFFTEAAEKAKEHENIPGYRGYKQELMLSFTRLGEGLFAQNDFAGATVYYQRALKLGTELVSGNPTVEERINTTVLYSRLASAFKAQGKKELYLMHVELYEKKSLEIATEIRSISVWRNLARAYGEHSEAFFADGDMENALEYITKAEHIFSEVAEESPTPDAKRDLWVCCDKKGDYLMKNGMEDDALEYFNNNLKLALELVESNNTCADRYKLYIAYTKLGNFGRSTQNYEQAKRYHEQAYGVIYPLAEATYAPKYLFALSITYYNYGLVCMPRENFLEAISLIEYLCKKYPENSVYKEHKEMYYQALHLVTES